MIKAKEIDLDSNLFVGIRGTYIDINGPFVKRLDAAVKKARDREEWRLEYMTLLMRDRENYEQGYGQGMLHLLISLVNERVLSKEDAAVRQGVTVEQFEKLMESSRK